MRRQGLWEDGSRERASGCAAAAPTVFCGTWPWLTTKKLDDRNDLVILAMSPSTLQAYLMRYNNSVLDSNLLNALSVDDAMHPIISSVHASCDIETTIIRNAKHL